MRTPDTRIAEDLRLQGFVVTELAGLGSLSSLLIEKWARFMEMPEEMRDLFSVPAPLGHEGDEDEGYVRRIGKIRPKDGVLYDPKDFFHWRPNLEFRLKQTSHQHLALENALYEHREFLSLCAGVYNVCLRTCLDVAGQFDTLLGSEARNGILQAIDLHALRLLYYRKKSGQDPAKQHFDRCFLTAQIKETNPGFCYIHPRTGQKIYYKSSNERNLLFLGKKAEAMLGIPALSHGVEEVSTLSEGCVRMSIVFFCHSDNKVL